MRERGARETRSLTARSKMRSARTRLVNWIWSRPYLLLTFTALFWAGNSLVGRAARNVMPPVSLAFWRWALALLLLLPFAWPHLGRDWRVLRVNWKWVMVLGTLGIGTFNTLLYTGLQTTTAVNGLLLQSLQPALILMLGALIFGENVRIPQIIGICFSIAGALASSFAAIGLRSSPWNSTRAIS